MHLRSVKLRVEQYPTDEHYPFNLPVMRFTRAIDFDSPITFFVGDNGSGKSTLLEAIARRCGIHIWEMERGRRCERNPYERALAKYLAVEWTDGRVPGSYFGSNLFHDFAAILDEWAAADPGQLRYFGGQSLMTQSHGQSLMAFFRARCSLRGLYLLDEPETALSPRSQIELLRLLTVASRESRAQFILASHSPILMACPGATLLSFDTAPVSRIEYEDTEHFRIYRDFMADRDRCLRDL
ncbi:MAG: AAA family ATPase [Armatimonadetes bacterium]|nr:AAA family ATPase [Armatimonadota bacterium]